MEMKLVEAIKAFSAKKKLYWYYRTFRHVVKLVNKPCYQLK